jgi:hypothetical protein
MSNDSVMDQLAQAMQEVLSNQKETKEERQEVIEPMIIQTNLAV